VESQAKEKMVCRCEKCNQVIVDSESKLRQAMETGDFATVDTVLHAILKGQVDIDIKLKHEAQRLHLRLEKELDIRNFINSVQHVDNYKTIRKSVKILTEKQETAEKLGVQLDPMLVHEINQCVGRLFSERDLRYQMENTEVPSCTTTSVEDLEKLIDKA
jgi:DNA polymerase III delta prime subunit